MTLPHQLYEAVPVSELPPIDKSEPDWDILQWSEPVFVNTSDGISHGFYAYRERVWYSNGKILSNVNYWLRPYSPEELVRYVAEKTWKIAIAWYENSGGPADDFFPNQSTFTDNLVKEVCK